MVLGRNEIWMFSLTIDLSFEERARYVENIVQNKDPTMFEDFAANVFAPLLPPGESSVMQISGN